jgi:hypothetical protein
MSAARYFIPEHPKLTDVYSKGELRALLQAGKLSRSDMVTDDETGIAHLLGDLLAMPFPDASMMPARSTSSLQPTPQRSHEFRADTPLPRPEHEVELGDDSATDDDDGHPNDGDDVHQHELADELNEEEVVEDEQEAVGEDDQDQDHDQEAEDAESERVTDESASGKTLRIEEDEERQPDPDEELLYIGHPSWLAFPKALFITAVCVGAAVFFRQHQVGWEWITLLGSIAGLILLFIGLDRTTTT